MGGNQYKEKWTLDEAKELFEDAIELSYNQEYDFIGEITQKLKIDKSTLLYLVEKFPELKPLKTTIKENCETNCFRNGKKGDINTAMAIVNLKSNHGWTDRSEQTIKTEQPLFGD